MKTALMSALVALGWIGLTGNIPAVAQNGASVPVIATPDSPVSPSAPAAQRQADSQTPSPDAQTPAYGSAATPSAAPYAPAGGPTLVDNGLWEGAMVGPGCSKCGGGNANPPDWYTMQGVRILSRSKPRTLNIAFEAPSTGLFSVQEVTGSPTAEFQVVNVTTPTASVTTSTGTTVSYEAMNTKSIGLNVAPGYDMTIGHYFCRDRNNNDHFVEFSFWGLNSWSDSKTINGVLVPTYDETVAYTQDQVNQINAGSVVPTTVANENYGNLRTPYPELNQLPGATPQQQTLSLAFNNGTSYAISYRSNINNFEINGRIVPRGEPDRLVLHPDGRWREECQPGTYMSYLYGLRYMQLDENFTFHSQTEGFFTPSPNLVRYTGTGDYDIVTHNDMLGLQIGADMTFRKCKWAWGVQAKAGPYINFSNEDSTISGQVVGPSLPNVTQRLVGDRYTAAIISEVGFQAIYKFRPNLMARAAWDFMWVSGVALAPEQLQFVANPTERINTNGTIFSQGVSLGLEWMW